MLGHGAPCGPVGTTRRWILRQNADQTCDEHGVQFPGYCSWELEKPFVVSSVVVAGGRHKISRGQLEHFEGERSS